MEDGVPEPTLQSVVEHDTLKWIFVGGKGGVGKTTCSCSLAIQLAAVRESVLIISTDPAHNLSDAFRQKFVSTPTLVEGFRNLYAMEVDPKPEESDLDGLEGSSFLTDIAGSIPGIDEAMSFAEVMRQVQTMHYKAIIFDTAPTGHTLRLLQFPSMLNKALSKLMGLRGMMGGLLDQFASMMGGMGGVQEGLLGKLEELKAVVEEVNKQFRDPDLTTFVCVCIPEFLSLYETERLVQELAKFEIDTNNIVINQVIFEEEIGNSRLLRARIRMQQKYIDQYDELYDDFHLVKLPLLEEEVRGTDALKEFSQNLMTPYRPPSQQHGESESHADELARLRQRCRELEEKYEGKGGSKS